MLYVKKGLKSCFCCDFVVDKKRLAFTNLSKPKSDRLYTEEAKQMKSGATFKDAGRGWRKALLHQNQLDQRN